ncbi:MAG TPA: VWA domain-containing protein [Terriglobales bacterium]|jgi:VWFA-related protein|nr:VWA domain-containing protein [Terriglobales bacterium]
MKEFAINIGTLLLLAGGLVAAQQPSPAPKDPGLVMRVTTRMVLVDAVVLDKEGHPVRGLKPEDFTVTEGGVRQRIASFAERNSEYANAAAPPVLPPHVTTNRPAVTQSNSENGTVAVLLLDGLNTPAQNQIYVKQQMLKFLARQYDPNTKLAVIALTNKLTVLQNFTQDPLLLRAALDHYLAETAALGHTAGQMETPSASVPAAIVNLPAQAKGGPTGSGPDPGLPATLAAGGSNSTIFEDIAYMMDRFERESENFSRDIRISTTLSALEQIGRFMSGQNGRKVLLWFSTGFPFSVVGDSPSAMEAERNYGDQIRRTINLLNDAHVATYTIDAGGLAPNSIGDPGLSGRDSEGRIHLGIDANRALSSESFQRFSTHDALETIARDTGGRYFGNSNDLDQAIRSALKESSSYYMLGYYPINKKWDGKFRNVKLQVDRPGTQLRYRRGYFATNPTDWKKNNGEHMLTAALAANSLPSTEVTFMARALPPQPNSDTVVEFAIDPSTLSFQTEAGNLHRCMLQFEVQAFTPDGKRVKAEVQTAEASLPEPTYEKVSKQELPMSVPIRLAPGKYILRLGVRDNLTGLFGTADLPLEVPTKRESKE